MKERFQDNAKAKANHAHHHAGLKARQDRSTSENAANKSFLKGPGGGRR